MAKKEARMRESEIEQLWHAVLGCGSPLHAEGIDALITRLDRSRRHVERLGTRGLALLRLADDFLTAPAGTTLAERRWWLMRQVALAQRQRGVTGDQL
jgi:hypothetical protein